MSEKAKRIRKVGSVSDAQRELWRAIVCSRTVLMDPESGAELTLKAAHAVQQCVSAYVRLQDAADFRAELDALKRELADLREGAKLRKVV